MGFWKPEVVYYETTKRELHRRLKYECRCDVSLKVKAEGSTRLGSTGLRGGLEHLKTDTRLRDERFASVMGECVILTPQVRRRYSKRFASLLGSRFLEDLCEEVYKTLE